MIEDPETLESVLHLVKQMEATLLGMQQLRGYTQGVGKAMLELLIDEAEQNLAEVKKKLSH